MAHDVFISYSSKDKTAADALCATFEAQGISCWIAPRNIAYGSDYGEAIVDGINESRVMVLVFSSHANTSPHIKREVDRAVSKNLTIIPIRIEDVALGCAAALVAGALFWPRGAGAALGTAIAESYRLSGQYLRDAIDFVAGRRPEPEMHGAAQAASLRLDDALRQYLAERGAKRMQLEGITALANGATRLRLAAYAVTGLGITYPDTEPDVPDPILDRPITVLRDRTGQITTWFGGLADVLAGARNTAPPVETEPSEASFLDIVLPAVDRCGDPDRAARAERLLWSGQYVGDVSQVRSGLVAPANEIGMRRKIPWWHL